MKLYNGFSPNGLRVAVFLQEKGIEIPTETVDVMKEETRSKEHLERNSLGEIPVLELDNGTYLTETIAICRYLEALNPEPRLMGCDDLDVAKVEMWNRRMEQQIMGPCAQYGLHVIPVFANKIEQMPEYAETQKRLMEKKWAWLDGELADGREFVAGDEFTVADITGMAALMIGGFLEGLSIPGDLANVQKWAEAMSTRKSFLDFSL